MPAPLMLKHVPPLSQRIRLQMSLVRCEHRVKPMATHSSRYDLHAPRKQSPAVPLAVVVHAVPDGEGGLDGHVPSTPLHMVTAVHVPAARHCVVTGATVHDGTEQHASVAVHCAPARSMHVVASQHGLEVLAQSASPQSHTSVPDTMPSPHWLTSGMHEPAGDAT